MIHPQLSIFITVVEQGSFTKAGNILHLTPTALMKQMNQLESRIGTKLLERTNHGVFLTHAGEIFLDEARSFVELNRMAIGHVLQSSGNGRDLKVGTSLLNPFQPFFSRWQAMSADLPQVNFTLVPFEDDHRKTANIVHALGATIDLFAGVCDAKLWQDSVQLLKMDNWNIVCAVPRTHALAEKSVIELEDLRGQNVMSLACSYSTNAHKELQEAGANLHEITYFYDLNLFNKCAQKGYLMLTLIGWRDVHPGFVLRTIRWKNNNTYTVPFGLVYSKTPSELTEWVVEQIKNSQDKDIQ